jgi:hypothetical protein
MVRPDWTFELYEPDALCRFEDGGWFKEYLDVGSSLEVPNERQLK